MMQQLLIKYGIFFCNSLVYPHQQQFLLLKYVHLIKHDPQTILCKMYFMQCIRTFCLLLFRQTTKSEVAITGLVNS